MSNPHVYTIGWICAIETEYVAAQEFLDEEHDPPEYVSTNDTNDYTLGRLGTHNVVIAVLPDGEYGTSSAASVATNMLHSFPNVRIGVLVGIGGGAPSSKHDIRLGDVVVSASHDGTSGVFQYDFGKTIQNQTFQHTRFLNQPPTALRTALTGIQAQYKRKGHQLEAVINIVLEQNSRLRQEYKRPAPDTDRLFKAEATHDLRGCAAFCASEPSNLVPRRERTKTEDNPAIHYGLIASANQLMKDATVRDRLAAEKDVLCFEMEAAGLMNNFPCLIIRGICDYSDSHKSKEWQGYAAMVAAAYAKDVLCRLAPRRVTAEKKIGDILSSLHEVAEEQRHIVNDHRNIAKEQLQAQKDQAKEKLSKEEQTCHQLFRLTTSNRDASYEWYKDRVEERVDGTCLWFLNHERFQIWLKQEFGPLLVTADPGCGKSVLAKYLIDHGLPQSTTICYFFFKDHDQNTVRQALCALLHQLFSQNPSLIEHAMIQFREDGQGLINSTKSLWKVLRNATGDPRAGPVIVVLDALDECAEAEFPDLVRNVESQFCSNQMGCNQVKYLLTSRPYEQIVSKFRGLLDAFPYICIPGQEECATISQEVSHVIIHRCHQLAKEKALSQQVKIHLIDQLLAISHRTYLWVYLVFDYLKTKDFKKTPKGVRSAISNLPETVNDAYERILSKSIEPSLARKVLCIILAACRPLAPSEMNVAANIDINADNKSQSIYDLDLEDEEDFKLRLRSCCGLFISIYHNRIYFLHQTAREFLLADSASPTTIPSELRWYQSITTSHAHAVLAKVCMLYLNLFNYNASYPMDTNTEAEYHPDSRAFLDYSAKTWAAHFRHAHIIDDAAIVRSALRICDPGSKSYSTWFTIYWGNTGMRTPGYFTGLMVASYLGHSTVVKALLDKGVEIDAKDSRYGRTPQSWAAGNGHEDVVAMLLSKGADLNAKDRYGRTSLSQAAGNGHVAVVKLLLDRGADVESKDEYNQTALSLATEIGHEVIVKLLIENGADIGARDRYGDGLLLLAARNGNEAIVKQLLDDGADVGTKNQFGRTSLSQAAGNGHVAVVKLLLDRGADVESKDEYNQTALSRAARNRHEAIVKLLIDNGAGRPLWLAARNRHQASVKQLLDKGADVEARDRCGDGLLLLAARNRDEATVKHLLDKGADIESKDEYNQTALYLASEIGHEVIVKLLLDNGADMDAKGPCGRTPLWLAARHGHEAVVKMLLDMGANVDAKDHRGEGPLSLATRDGHEAIVKLLLDKSANVKSRARYSQLLLSRATEMDHDTVVKPLVEKGVNSNIKDCYNDRMLLSWAAENGFETVVKLLLDKGADVNSKIRRGRTPLWWAAANGNVAIVKLLLEAGTDVNAMDRHYARTPLSVAAENGHEAVVKLLLDKGADVDAMDRYDRTSLSWAAEHGYEAIIKLLLEEGADIDTKARCGRTPVSWAAENAHEAIVELLQQKPQYLRDHTLPPFRKRQIPETYATTRNIGEQKACH